MCWLSKFFTGTVERPSPSDIVPEGNIRYDVSAGLILILLGGLNIPFTKPPKVWISSIPGTLSMDPVFDKEHNNIYIAGIDNENQKSMVDWLAKEWFDKKMANIIVYRIMANPADSPLDFSKAHKIYPVHRLSRIKVEAGERKWYFKGDNNITEDPYPAKDENILYLCIGTVF